jgi:hypothetical protein
MLCSIEAWNGESRLSDVLKHYPDALSRLAELDPRLAHLKGEEARPMVRLIRLGELATIAELPLDMLIAALRGEKIDRAAAQRGSAAPPEAVISEDAAAIRLDVRPMLAGGQEPFAAIMAAAARVPEGGALILEAPFDPAPLRRVLAGKGFTSQGQRIAEGHWRIIFRRAGALVPSTQVRSGQRWVEADGTHLDVRGLEPPQPMIQILALIDSGEVEAFTVHHERDPIFLYPELEERGWHCRILAEMPGELRLTLSRRR